MRLHALDPVGVGSGHSSPVDPEVFEDERLLLDASAPESMEATASASEGSDHAKASKWRIRKRVWDLMEANDIARNPRPVHHRISSFIGAPKTAEWALKGSTQLLEQAKTIINDSSSSIPSGKFGWNDVSSERAHENQVELQGKRGRQRRPGLLGVERAKHAFKFSSKTTSAPSEMVASEFFKGSSSSEANYAPDAQSWPVIDYSCLKNISDPVEYFSTYRMLENAEKEVKRLKGEVSLKPSQPHGKRDRQRRPGLSNLEGKKAVFKFPDVAASVKDSSQVENSSLSHGSNITKVALASPFKEPRIDKKSEELEKLLSACRDAVDDTGIANCIRDILQINPTHMGNSDQATGNLKRDEQIDDFDKFKSMASEADPLRFLKPTSLIDIEARLHEISTLKTHIGSQSTCDVPLYGDRSSSKIREQNSPSPVEVIRFESSLDAQNASAEDMPSQTNLSFEDKMHSPIVDDEIADVPKELLHAEAEAEAPKDDCLPEESTFTDNTLNVINENNGNMEDIVKSPPRQRKRRQSIMSRKSLAGAGTVIESGVRRSTRIRMKPLQYWCGERFLYGRVHKSLATVIGVKKFATPDKGGRPVMKVKSYVSEQYADLVAQAALY